MYEKNYAKLNLSICIYILAADVVSLQNLQNLANLPKVAPLADGLQSMSSDLSNNHLINTPLNLTVTTSGKNKKKFII